jgi:hypothetical protein
MIAITVSEKKVGGITFVPPLVHKDAAQSYLGN